MDVTRKIGVSVPDELYDWAAGEVAAGRADSVSALVTRGLHVLVARSELAQLGADLDERFGRLDEATRSQVDRTLEAALGEAQRRLGTRADDTAA